MKISTFDNKLHHLQELSQLERMFVTQFDSEGFYDSLTQFVQRTFNLETNSIPTETEILILDNWVKDYLLKRLTDAERWIVRGWLIGKMIEEAERKVPQQFLINIKTLPEDIQKAAVDYNLNLTEVHALQWAKTRGGQNIKGIANDTAKIVRNKLLDTIQHGGGYRLFQKKMEAEVLTAPGDINRMWRRVAITEINTAFNNAYLAQLKEGTYVVGLAMPDACDNCKRLLNGKIFVTTEKIPPADYMYQRINSFVQKQAKWLWENALWMGKNNVGRSFSPRKKRDPEGGNAPDNLIDREHDELGMPCIPAHPHCRCRTIRIDPAMFWIDKLGNMRIKIEDPQAWEKWYNSQIKPLEEGYKKYVKDLTTTY